MFYLLVHYAPAFLVIVGGEGRNMNIEGQVKRDIPLLHGMV